MKRYKLLKDIAGLKAGSILYLNEFNNLIADDKATIVFMPSFVEKYGLLDSDWLEEIPEGYKRWRAEEYGKYWHVGSFGIVGRDYENKMDIDNMRYSIGNYFKTEEEAQKAAEWLKALTVLRDDTKGFKPNWWNCDQEKWVVEYHPHDNVHLTTEAYCYTQNGVIYFATEDDALESIKKHERQWLTFFNCGVEEQE